MFAAFLPAIWASHTTDSYASSLEYAATPSFTRAEMVAEKQKLEAGLAAPVSADPVQYYRLLVETERDGAIAQKYLDSHPDERSEFMLLAVGLGGLGLFNQSGVQERYNERFSQPRMADVSTAHPELTGPYAGKFSQLPALGGSWVPFEKGVVASFVIALFFFGIRVTRFGMNVWIELDRIILWSLIWPVGLVRYPVKVDLRAQFIRAKQRMAYLMAMLISLFSFGGLAKAAEQKNDDVANTSDHTLVLDIVPEPPDITFSAGVDSKKIIGSGLVVHDGLVAWSEMTAVFKNGIKLDLWGSRNFDGPRKSNENDITISWAGKVVGDLSANVGIAYYDLRPFFKRGNGDVASAFGEVDLPVGHGFTAFAKWQGLFVTKGANRNGHVASLGLKAPVIKLGGGIELNQDVSVLEAAGPFGAPEGISAHYDASVSIPIADRLKAAFSFKGFAPLRGAKGRPADASVGLSLSYAF